MAPEDPRHAAWRAKFDSLGEEAVRMMDSGSQTTLSDEIRFSRVWLAMRAEAKRDAREEETLSIAKEANRIASEARKSAKKNADAASDAARWAKWAAIIAAITAIAANQDSIRALIL